MPKSTDRFLPWTSIRAFESAARHLSFTKAAEDLRVTPAAISLQVKALEQYLGMPLFTRGNRSLSLTDCGRKLLPELQDALGRVARATDAVKTSGQVTSITISTTPSLAAKWLAPRLHRFYAAHPDVILTIQAANAISDLSRDGIDLALRYGSGNSPGHYVERLLSSEAFPVCHPSLLTGDDPIKVPSDLARHVLLHDINSDNHHSLPSWSRWLRAAGAGHIGTSTGLRFSNTYLAIEAAIRCQGVALGLTALVEADMEEGNLVRPFAMALPVEYAYFLVCLPETLERPAVRALRDWLLAEAEAIRRGP